MRTRPAHLVNRGLFIRPRTEITRPSDRQNTSFDPRLRTSQVENIAGYGRPFRAGVESVSGSPPIATGT